jgi:hypothetical protein
MSIITEALKKVEAKRLEGSVPKAPPEVPQAVINESGRKPESVTHVRRFGFFSTLALSLSLFLLAAFSYIIIFRKPAPPPPKIAAQPTQPADNIQSQQERPSDSQGITSRPKTEPAPEKKAEPLLPPVFYQSIYGRDRMGAQDSDSGIALNGIMYSVQTRCAVINNTMVREGETISGAKVIKITRDEVVLTRGSSEIRLKLKK